MTLNSGPASNCQLTMSPFHRSSLMPLPDVEQRELDGRAEQVHVVRQVAHHAVGVAEREGGVVGLVAHALRDAIEVHQARQVQLRARLVQRRSER